MKKSAISHKDFLLLTEDSIKAANAADLLYVTDETPGISRRKKGKDFAYFYNNRKLSSKEQIERIKSLVLPPAWQDVWICYSPKGHIQATGYDVKQRKQYRYHTLWNKLRNETKYHKLYEFGLALPKLRTQLEKDLKKPEFDESKVLAIVISVMERTFIRVGNAAYEKANGSFGLTTLKDKHVTINGAQVEFCFKGKKGVHHTIQLNNKRLAKAVKACKDIPGKELFQYYTKDGKHHKSIDSGMVNTYIKDATGGHFTAKEFRTWAGSLHMLHALKSFEKAEKEHGRKSTIVAALDMVSKKLGNTRTVCKKYYVHPGIIELYNTDKIDDYLAQLNDVEESDGKSGFAHNEKILMSVLKALIDTKC